MALGVFAVCLGKTVCLGAGPKALFSDNESDRGYGLFESEGRLAAETFTGSHHPIPIWIRRCDRYVLQRNCNDECHRGRS